MQEEEYEYRVPAKLLNSRDPIILNKLSMGEAAQWLLFGFLMYLSFNALPLDGTFKLVIAGSIFMAGLAFIHSPINGLAGIEWSFIYLRFNLEKKWHRTLPPVEALTSRTLISVKATSYTLGSYPTHTAELEETGESLDQEEPTSTAYQTETDQSESEVETV